MPQRAADYNARTHAETRLRDSMAHANRRAAAAESRVAELEKALERLTDAAAEYRKMVSPQSDRQWAMSDVLWNEIGAARSALSPGREDAA